MRIELPASPGERLEYPIRMVIPVTTGDVHVSGDGPIDMQIKEHWSRPAGSREWKIKAAELSAVNGTIGLPSPRADTERLVVILLSGGPDQLTVEVR